MRVNSCKCERTNKSFTKCINKKTFLITRFDEENLFEHYSDEDEEDDFIKAELHDQQQLRSTQDQHLDVMSEGLTRLKDVSHAIADELDEHNRLLNDLDEDIADTDSRIAFVTGQTNELIKKSGGGKWFCLIVALTIMAIVLFFLIIS